MVYSRSAKCLLIIAALPEYFQTWDSHPPEWEGFFLAVSFSPTAFSWKTATLHCSVVGHRWRSVKSSKCTEENLASSSAGVSAFCVHQLWSVQVRTSNGMCNSWLRHSELKLVFSRALGANDVRNVCGFLLLLVFAASCLFLAFEFHMALLIFLSYLSIAHMLTLFLNCSFTLSPWAAIWFARDPCTVVSSQETRCFRSCKTYLNCMNIWQIQVSGKSECFSIHILDC